MADKWDEKTSKIARAILANEPGAILDASLDLFAEFGRTIELIGEDVNRLATAAEKLAEK